MPLDEFLAVLALWYLVEGVVVCFMCIRPNLEIEDEDEIPLAALWTVLQLAMAVLLWPRVLYTVWRMKREGIEEGDLF